MNRNVVVAGVLAGIVIVLWMFVVNGILGFKSRIDMKPIPNERGVYESLKSNITEPGRYMCNPEADPSTGFPPNQPVFSILYGGVGHEAAGRMALIQLPLFFLAPLIAGWMLSKTSREILVSLPKRVLFVSCFGLLFGVWGRLGDFGIGSYPLGDAFALALHDLVLWAVVGLVLAWRIRPDSQTEELT